MADKREMEIDYLNRKTKVTLPEKYSDFLELCKQTFYISESRSQNMFFYYYEEEVEIPIDEEEYKNPDSRKSECWKLVIEEEEDDIVGIDLNQLENELKLKKNQIINQTKKFKEDLFKNLAEKVKEEIIKRNEKHQEKIQKVKDEYINNLVEFRKQLNKQNEEFLNKISDTLLDVYQKNMLLIDEAVKDNIKGQMKTLGDNCKKDLEDLDLNDIGKVNFEIKKNIQTCIDKFNKMMNDKVINMCLISAKETKSNLKNEIDFQLNVKNLDNKNFNGKYTLEIRKDKEKYNVPVDLSDINPKEEKVIEVHFKPLKKKKGEHYFDLEIKENDKSISNKSKLKLTLIEIGDNDDLFGGN